MKILWLGPQNPLIYGFFSRAGDSYDRREDPVLELQANRYDHLVSFGYRHRVLEHVLEVIPGAKVNVHLGYLPWNRGAHPNLWSWIDDTPKGVTIHEMTPALDRGPIIVQERVDLSLDHTLASSYQQLRAVGLNLLSLWWPRIREGLYTTYPQRGRGTYHSQRESLDMIRRLLHESADYTVHPSDYERLACRTLHEFSNALYRP